MRLTNSEAFSCTTFSEASAASEGFSRDVAILGGCGRVGLPLGVALASRGLTVTLHDFNLAAVETVNAGRLPFREKGAEGPLRRAVQEGRLVASPNPSTLSTAEYVVIVIGTPVDEHLNPDVDVVPRVIGDYASYLADGQLVILRSTVPPGVTKLVELTLASCGVRAEVAFCPERLAEGNAMTELFDLPQIVAARDQHVRMRAEKLFLNLTARVVHLTPEEAELAKLYTNAWRYVKFAMANQFWMIANDAGLDFEPIRHAVTVDYPRAADLPRAGFAAGPCLLKDTMQLAAFSGNAFALGHAAMMVNEGLPLYLVEKLQARYDLANMTVGILGMAFKGGSDDPRDSLSYRLRKLLRMRAKDTLCSDGYITNNSFVGMEELLRRSDLAIVAAPHPEYRDLVTDIPVADLWGITGRGVLI